MKTQAQINSQITARKYKHFRTLLDCQPMVGDTFWIEKVRAHARVIARHRLSRFCRLANYYTRLLSAK